MFTGRLKDGTIYGVWSVAQPDDADHPNITEVKDDDPDVLAFLNRPLPVSERTIDLADVQIKLDRAIVDISVPQPIKDVMVALKKVLGA